MPPKSKTQARKSRVTRGRSTKGEPARAQTIATRPKRTKKRAGGENGNSSEDQQQTQRTLLGLPIEIQVEILSYISVLDQIAACEVCPLWKTLLCQTPCLQRVRYPPCPSGWFDKNLVGIHDFFRQLIFREPLLFCTLDHRYEGIEKIYMKAEDMKDEMKNKGNWVNGQLDITNCAFLDDRLLSPFELLLAKSSYSCQEKRAHDQAAFEDAVKKFAAARQTLEATIVFQDERRWIRDPIVSETKWRQNEDLTLREILEGTVQDLCWNINSGQIELEGDGQIHIYFKVTSYSNGGNWTYGIEATARSEEYAGP
ncbi:hypothetical protein Dda_7834 [Drechslerella dactyloides]|uniref:F-box domain-containing protein n=1 Tax=Drechslerella dactyloides TaxID=74499 RepID=A0AAD6IUG8_DREDA|nr:hypothetical protein Dda_7834 [Drechslerella dactyloides]